MKPRSTRHWNEHANGRVTPEAVTNFANKIPENKLGIYFYIYTYLGRRTGLVTFCVETAFYNGLLKERYKGG